MKTGVTMGEKSDIAGQFYLIGPGGQMRAVEEPVQALVEAPEAGNNWIGAVRGDWEWEVCFALPKILRCRSRKRLVKLLMSTRGVDRNTACEIAEWMRSHGVKYQNVWRTYLYGSVAQG